MARPTKLTPKTRDEIVKLLASGASIANVATAAGVDSRTLERWLARARELRKRQDAKQRIRAEDRIYLELDDALDKSRALVIVEGVATVRKAALAGDWRAAAWFLERVAPDEYAPPRSSGRMGRPLGSGSAPDRRPGSGPAMLPGEPPRLQLATSPD